MYIHWASMNCPSGARHMLIISGNLLLSAAEGIQLTQPICQTMEVNNTLGNSFVRVRPLRTSLSNITCALCLIPDASVTYVHYGSSVCPFGSTLAYNGLMVVPTGVNATTPFCAATGFNNLSSVSFLTDERGNNLACSVCSM